jgi:hypothetical protein
MKTTISGRPDAHKIEFPCLMNLKSDKDTVAIVHDLGEGLAHVTILTKATTNLYRLNKNTLFANWELFVGELTLQND